MKNQIIELNKQLKAVHRRFLENERVEAEKIFERRLSPFDFLSVLTGDQRFFWLRPFSALIADIDAFVDDSEEVTMKDLARLERQISIVIHEPDSKIFQRLQLYISNDPEFALLNSKLNAIWNSLFSDNKGGQNG